MKKTGPLLYTMFFFLQNQALFSAKGFLFYKNTKKISEKQIVSFLFFLSCRWRITASLPTPPAREVAL